MSIQRQMARRADRKRPEADRRWPRASQVSELHPTNGSIRTLHPTKGWLRTCKARVALRIEAARMQALAITQLGAMIEESRA